MLLRLQRFNLTVKYKPGSQMLLADHLSRAAQHETSRPEESFQIISLELERLDPMQALKVTPERLDQLQRNTSHFAGTENHHSDRMANAVRSSTNQDPGVLVLPRRAVSTQWFSFQRLESSHPLVTET